MTGMVAPVGGGRTPAIILNGAKTAPGTGNPPPAVRPPARVYGGPNPGGLASPQNSTASRPHVYGGPNPGGLASPQNNPPAGGRRAPSAAARVAAGKASTGGSGGGGQPKPATSAQIMAAAERQAASIYNPAIANYNAQQAAQNGLAEKRTSDLAAFGQWYQGQQNVLAAEEATRQNNLQSLLGQLNQSPASGTPTGGVQSSIGNNLNATSGGQASTAAQGANAATSGILSTNALENASSTNSSQNELTALGGAYQQNMMGQISADLTKNTAAIGNDEAKVYTAEGNTAGKLDSTFQTAQTAGQKSYLNYLTNTQKNQIQSNYDSEQANSKAASEILATAEANGWTPTLRAAYARYMGGAVPSTGPTIQQQKVTQAGAIAQQKLNQTAYNDVTRRLAVQATNTKTADTYALGQIKLNLESAAQGEKVKLTNAEIQSYAARAGLSRAEAKAALTRAVAYAAAQGVKVKGATATGGVKPYTTNEAATQLGRIPATTKYINALLNGEPATTTKAAVPALKTPQAVRQYLNRLGTQADPLVWAAFDMRFNNGKLTPRTYQMLLNQGFTKAQLANYSVAK